MVRRSSATSRGTGSIVFSFLCPGYLVCACTIFLTCCAYQNHEKQSRPASRLTKVFRRRSRREELNEEEKSEPERKVLVF